MSLLVDSDFVTLADLIALDAEVAEISDGEDIKIEGDQGIARQAWGEVADTLTAEMQTFGGGIITWPGTLSTYGAFGISRPRIRMNHVVVTTSEARRDSALHHWMTYKTLVLFYRAASNRLLNDRFEQKWKRFTEDTKDRWNRLWAAGLPMVARPLACPGAIHELNAGTWDSTNVTAVSGGSSTDEQRYDVAITWTDSGYVSATNPQNGESGPSATITVTVPASNVIRVSIASLNPPSSAAAMIQRRGIADGPYITRDASGWNVYAGPAGGTMTLQNSTPIPIATTSYTFSSAPTTGSALYPGQFPDANYTFMRMLNRG